jgi:hypothetical protein
VQFIFRTVDAKGIDTWSSEGITGIKCVALTQDARSVAFAEYIVAPLRIFAQSEMIDAAIEGDSVLMYHAPPVERKQTHAAKDAGDDEEQKMIPAENSYHYQSKEAKPQSDDDERRSIDIRGNEPIYSLKAFCKVKTYPTNYAGQGDNKQDSYDQRCRLFCWFGLLHRCMLSETNLLTGQSSFLTLRTYSNPPSETARD